MKKIRGACGLYGSIIRRFSQQNRNTLPEVLRQRCPYGGADVVLEAAGSQDSFRMAWQYARPNAVVTVVALYDEPQILPLPEMYGKNLIFKTGGVDGCNCAETLRLIENGKIDTTPLIHTPILWGKSLAATNCSKNRRDGVIKVAIQTAFVIKPAPCWK